MCTLLRYDIGAQYRPGCRRTGFRPNRLVGLLVVDPLTLVSDVSDMNNPFPRIYITHRDCPEDEQAARVTRDIHRAIPFTETAGLTIEAYTPTRVVVAVDDREALHNHVGTPHAAVLSLLSETASGLVVAINVRDPALPILRSMEVGFRRLGIGRLTAEAALSEDEAERIRNRPIGKIAVDVAVTTGNTAPSAETTMHWAWLPQSKLSLPASENG